MLTEYLSFVRSHPRLLLSTFLLCALSSFGQTFFVALWSAALRSGFGISDGVLGGAYAAATIGSGFALGWTGLWIDRLPLTAYTGGVAARLAAGCAGAALAPGLPVLTAAFFLLRLAGQGLMTHRPDRHGTPFPERHGQGAGFRVPRLRRRGGFAAPDRSGPEGGRWLVRLVVGGRRYGHSRCLVGGAAVASAESPATPGRGKRERACREGAGADGPVATALAGSAPPARHAGRARAALRGDRAFLSPSAAGRRTRSGVGRGRNRPHRLRGFEGLGDAPGRADGSTVPAPPDCCRFSCSRSPGPGPSSWWAVAARRRLSSTCSLPA
jgi:hypothetical protein